MVNDLRAVVFDLDDTLISEGSYQKSANSAVLLQLSGETGIPIATISGIAAEAAKGPRGEYFQSLLARLGIEPTEARVASMLSVHREHRPSVDFYPDVENTLLELRRRGILLGIITDGYSIAQWRKLEVISAERHFDQIVVTDDLGREYWKPHPRPFEEIAVQLGVSPEEMMYVGDNPAKDFFVSESLPIVTVRIVREGQLKAGLEYRGGVKERFRVESLTELPYLVAGLAGKTLDL